MNIYIYIYIYSYIYIYYEFSSDPELLLRVTSLSDSVVKDALYTKYLFIKVFDNVAHLYKFFSAV